MTTPALCALLVAGVACMTDLRSRRIPNVLTFGAASTALMAHVVAGGGHGLWLAIAGWVLGAAVFFLPFALGGLGAGDVKLLAALGAILGPGMVIWVALYSGVAGGVLAIIVAARYGYLRKAWRNVQLLLMHFQVMGIRPLHEVSLAGSSGPRLAYAIPIFAGLVAALWLR